MAEKGQSNESREPNNPTFRSQGGGASSDAVGAPFPSFPERVELAREGMMLANARAGFVLAAAMRAAKDDIAADIVDALARAVLHMADERAKRRGT